jgi:hypothetical protein
MSLNSRSFKKPTRPIADPVGHMEKQCCPNGTMSEWQPLGAKWQWPHSGWNDRKMIKIWNMRHFPATYGRFDASHTFYSNVCGSQLARNTSNWMPLRPPHICELFQWNWCLLYLINCRVCA